MKRFIPYILLALIVFTFFHQVLFQNKLPIPADTIVGLYHPFRDLYLAEFPNGVPFKNFLITDPVRQQYPWRTLTIELEKRLELPLWNPYSLSGTPLMAGMQSGAFYPLNILFFLLPFSTAWSIFIIIQPLLAAFFLYLYLDNLKLKKSASFLGAITFAFCGFSTTWLEWGTIVHTAIWLPLTLLAIDKIFYNTLSLRLRAKREGSNLNGIAAAISWLRNDMGIWSIVFIFSIASSFFAGHLQIFFYLALLSIAYFFARWFQFGKPKNILKLFLILASLFLILTIIQWLPTLNFILSSGRNIDQNWHKAGWFLPWQNLVQFIAPDFFGNPATINYWGIWNYAEFIGYIGIFPSIMVLLAFFQRRDKLTLFFGSIFFLSLIFSLPTFFAKIPFQLQVPFLSTAQPTRLLFLTDFSLAILTALGSDVLIRHYKIKKIIHSLVTIAVIFTGLWVFVLFGGKIFDDILAKNLLIAKRNLLFPTLMFAISIILIFFWGLLSKTRLAILILSSIIILVVFDLLRFGTKFTPFTSDEFLFPQTKTLKFLQQQKGAFRIMTLDDRILPPNFSIIYHLQSIDGYDPLYLLRYAELIAAFNRGGPDISTPFGFNRIITPKEVDSKLIDLLGVKYVLSLSDKKIAKLEKVFKEGQTIVYKNNQAFPRAFFVKNVLTASGKTEAINMMFDSKIDFRENAIVENVDNIQIDATKGRANIVEYKENNIVISTQNDGESYLVLMDSYYPTWNASICSDNFENCKETKIYLTNYNFRGIVVPAGNHKILFENNLL